MPRRVMRSTSWTIRSMSGWARARPCGRGFVQIPTARPSNRNRREPLHVHPRVGQAASRGRAAASSGSLYCSNRRATTALARQVREAQADGRSSARRSRLARNHVVLHARPPSSGRLDEMAPALTPAQPISPDRRPYSIFGQRFMTTLRPAASASAAAWIVAHAELHPDHLDAELVFQRGSPRA